MHGHVGVSSQDGSLDFDGEDTLPANLGKWLSVVRVAQRGDVNERDVVTVIAKE
jgi:hypothetical protein